MKIGAHRARFCSNKCTGEYQSKSKSTFSCSLCTKKFEDLDCNRIHKNKYCSRICLDKAKELSKEERTIRVIERLKTNINVDENGCHIWIGAKNKKGYGLVSYYGSKLAHRLAYNLMVKVISKGMFACHTCHNPPCINIKHLYAGTAQDNSNDMKARRLKNIINK